MIRKWPAGRILILLLVVGLAASASLNGWLIVKVLDYKGRLLLAREFPGDTPLYIAGDGRQLVWLTGDSRIASWALPDSGIRRFVNRGVSGFTARETLDRFRGDLAAGTRPDVVVIQAGINDVLSAGYNRRSRLPGAALEFDPNRPDPSRIMAQCLQDLKQLVATAASAGSQVILLTVFPPGPESLRDRFFWDTELKEHISRLNTALKALAGPSTTILDAASLLSPDGRTRDDYSSDALHLNDNGYSVLSGALESELARLSPAGRPPAAAPVRPSN